MNRWSSLHNPAATGNGKHPGTANKGLGRTARDMRREEAQTRNANTPHDRTRAHRLNRCTCET